MKSLLKSGGEEILLDGLRLCDVLVILLLSFVAYLFRHGEFVFSALYIFGPLFSATAFLFVAQGFGVYTSKNNFNQARLVFALGLSLLFVAFLFISVLFVLKASEDVSRLWFFYWFTLNFVVLNITHLAFYAWFKTKVAKGYFIRKAVLYVSQAQQGEYLSFFENRDDVKIVSVISNEKALHDYCLKNTVDDVILTQAINKKVVLSLSCRVSYCLPPELIFSKGEGASGVTLCRRPLSGRNHLLKRTEDLVLGGLIFVVISPLLLLIAGLIYLSGEKRIFFKQKRSGFYGKAFTVYKFRTMRKHIEAAGVVTQAKCNDPRITKLGAILRKFSLDELPQIINVLKGDMSLVGPRPHVLEHDDHYTQFIDSYIGRYRMKPGMSGWAQVNGWRGETDTLNKMSKRIEYDIYYIENWSLGFDLKILFLTFMVFLPSKNSNAY